MSKWKFVNTNNRRNSRNVRHPNSRGQRTTDSRPPTGVETVHRDTVVYCTVERRRSGRFLSILEDRSINLKIHYISVCLLVYVSQWKRYKITNLLSVSRVGVSFPPLVYSVTCDSIPSLVPLLGSQTGAVIDISEFMYLLSPFSFSIKSTIVRLIVYFFFIIFFLVIKSW